ncbi:MAG: DMT family transporter [Anaerolineae bacterium]
MKAKDWGAFLLLSVVWGSSFLWIKVALDEIGPVTLVAFRLLFGVLGLLIVLAVRRPPLPADRATWLKLALLGLTNTAIPFVLISWGEQFIDSGVTSILNASVPLFALVMAHFWLADERITWMRAAGLLIGFAGIVVLVSRDLSVESLGQNLPGQIAVLVAAAFYAFSSVFTRRALGDVSPIVQAFVPLVVADLATWALVPALELPWRGPALPITWLALAWLGLLGSCAAYLLYFSLIRSIGATRTTMVTYVIPVTGVALGVIFLGEPFDWLLLAATALIVTGIGIVNSRRAQRARPEEITVLK